MSHTPLSRFQRGCALMLAALVPLQGLLLPGTAAAQVNLADQPVFASASVPGNLALALSVEWPTASRTAHTAAYASSSTFQGYFDPNNVNMSEVAVNLGVSRGTIMRDLRLVESLMSESKRLQAILRNNPVGTTRRRS